MITDYRGFELYRSYGDDWVYIRQLVGGQWRLRLDLNGPGGLNDARARIDKWLEKSASESSGTDHRKPLATGESSTPQQEPPGGE